jgi:hypothetical protein
VRPLVAALSTHPLRHWITLHLTSRDRGQKQKLALFQQRWKTKAVQSCSILGPQYSGSPQGKMRPLGFCSDAPKSFGPWICNHGCPSLLFLIQSGSGTYS